MTRAQRRPLVEELIHNLRRASFVVQARSRETLSQGGLSMGQLVVLRQLVAAGRSTTKDLARDMGVTTGNVTGLVDKLEAEGLVARERSQTDRRVVHLDATSKGQAVFKDLHRLAIDGVAASLSDWDAKELQELNRLLRRIVDSGPLEC